MGLSMVRKANQSTARVPERRDHCLTGSRKNDAGPTSNYTYQWAKQPYSESTRRQRRSPDLVA
jgi:hypothetical protein